MCLPTIRLSLLLPDHNLFDSLSPTTIKAQLRAMGKCTTFGNQFARIRHRVHKAAKPGRKERGRWVGRKQSTSPKQQATEARVGWVGENKRQARHDQAYKPATRTQPELSQLPQSTSHKYSKNGTKDRQPLRLTVQVDQSTAERNPTPND